MTIDITKITPEKLAEMNDTLLVDNTYLRDTVANLRKQVATHEQSLAAYRNKVIEECAKGCDAEYRDPHNLPAAIVAKRCADTVRAMKEPE